MRIIFLTFLAAIAGSAIDLVLGAVAVRFTGVPRGFPPFTALPILSGTVGGAILASLAYALIRLTANDPERLFFFATLTTFALSLGLPLRLSFTRSPRFAGVTPAAQMVLVLMHAVVATACFLALTAKPYR